MLFIFYKQRTFIQSQILCKAREKWSGMDQTGSDIWDCLDEESKATILGYITPTDNSQHRK
jgi:hypothetical protein